MGGRYNRQRRWGYLKRFLVNTTLLALIVILSYSIWGVYKTNKIARDKRDEVAEGLEALLERAAELTGRTEYLSTDRGLEEEFRTKFQVSKLGEEVIVIVDPNTGDGKDAGVRSGLWSWIKSIFARD